MKAEEAPKADKPDKTEKPEKKPAKAESEKPAKAEEPAKEEAPKIIDRKTVIDLGKKLVKAGKAKEVSSLMKDGYGVKKFSEIQDDQLAEVYAKMEELENA